MNERAVMNSILRKRAAEKKAEMQQSAVDAALGSLAMGGKPRVDRAVARAVLIGVPWFWNGVSMSPVGRSVGAGIWELRIEANSELDRSRPPARTGRRGGG